MAIFSTVVPTSISSPGKGGRLSLVSQVTKAMKQMEDEERTPRDDDQNEQIMKSLQIKADKRYERMAYYRDHGGSSSESGHFANLQKQHRHWEGKAEDAAIIDKNASFAEIGQDTVERGGDEWRIRLPQSGGVQDRIEWQRNFDRNVRRLFVDFQLTDAPGCRLNHLDRMDDWFTDHGQKQARKAEKGPSYLTVDRNTSVPPGSTKDISTKMSNTTLVLAGAYTARSYGASSSSSSSRNTPRN